ncbi:MATE family efflux transporter [Treponema denticola]|uniref:Multidrug export protein MepA n=1 Tax=Treponema denticola (strain ATCC 35405 / DSM 14222 / CIP 103919 / JCM 8153 / KCTC 15104) TaxID=243275 RepID=Q73QW0_TREDE|nr:MULTISPECIES: MATE family efflux transporter [Treponema]AAS10828.1 MATE efflux family protein [Treponema denticola ATCC 35405]EMB35466.1 MATE efflux family protein [Treponema denticola ATCC 35404]EMB41251.1 MATE efflux family protein [Treponema denticola ATCC 33521]UTD08566.1 MATE family efflux transporter [Treponema denticola]UYT07883.1 MATE family efflux transporter [Treponema denticola]
MTDKREHLISGNMFKLMLELSIPGIIGMFVISLYSFVDAIFVGRYVSSVALGAVSLAYTFTLINNGIAVLVGIGSASVLSRAVGRSDQETVDSIMGNVLLLTLLFSLGTMTIGLIFAPQLLILIGAEGEMLRLGVSYLRIVYIGSVFVNFGQAANMVMRGEGRMGLAMLLMGISAVLNIILDAVFVIVLKKGLEGTAIATVISQVVLAICNFCYFAFFSKNVKFKHFKLQKSIVKETLSIGFSAMLMQVFALLQQAVMYSTLKRYGGEDQVILMGAFFRYMMLSFIPLWGISQGYQPFAGTNFGAQKFERVKKGTFLFYGFGLFLSLIFWLVFLIIPEQVLGLFLKNKELISLGRTNAMLAMSLFPLSAIMIINLTLFQALGKAKYAGILVIARQFLLYIPAVLILPVFFGTRGVWISTPIIDTLVTVLSAFIVIKLFKKDLSPKDKPLSA